MSRSNLIELTYYDPVANVRLTTYADTIITEPTSKGESIAAVRFGGYPEMVRAMSDAIYGGGSIDFIQNGSTYQLDGTPKAYRRQLSHDGAYAIATLMINDEALSANPLNDSDREGDEEADASGSPEPSKPRKCYIFCPAKDRDSLFAEVDRKTSEPLSEEVLAVNDYIQEQAGYSLYDAQLAVAETVKRQLERRNAAFIVAECGTGKTKIGSTALGALHGLAAAQRRSGAPKTFNLVMCPSHVTRKWVREISETLPDTYAMVVRSITEFDRLYAMYEAGDKSVFAVFSKERARDGYMRYPAVTLKRCRKQRIFVCPDCGKPILQEYTDDGTKYFDYADQFFFRKEHRQNRFCRECGSVLWAPVIPGRDIPWTKVTDYGWVYKERAFTYLTRTKNAAIKDRLRQIADDPCGIFPVVGAVRRFPLSTYIKKKYRGRIDGFLCDELHEYNNNSGQGDAMAELFGVSKQFVGMTATLINGYSSGIFHLLYRVVPGLMKKDGKSYRSPSDFDAEYGVVENTYETHDVEYNSNRRTHRRKTQTRQLPGVSPLVFSRFLLEYTAFLSLSDMGKDLPDYEEIPVPLEMPEAWVEQRIASGLQVLITNPRCVETGLDLNAFTTLIFYSMGYNLFTLRQASRRSWRINQTAPRVEVYMLYYMDTMQAKAMKLMASKLAVAGLIEGSFSEEGLAAMSDVKDMTSQMAKELSMGIKDNVEDIAAAFKKMAVINPNRERRQAAALPAPEQKPAEPEVITIRTADSRQRQAVYEGLLEKSTLEKKRKKPRQELDNQLSIFGDAA